MRFDLVQHVRAPASDVAAAFADPAFYASLEGLPKLGTPEVLDHAIDGGTVRLRVRYRFVGELSSAVRAVVDPHKLTWIEDGTHDLAARQVSWTMVPDHYGDRFTCQGRTRYDTDGDDRTVRHATGDLRVRMALVAGRVERAIVSGLQEHLDAEAPLVEQWASGAQHDG